MTKRIDETRRRNGMGYAYREYIEMASQWLLKELETRNPIRFGEFYSRENWEAFEAIGRALGVPDHISFPVLVDLAAYRLERQGILKRRSLPHGQALADGNEDYEILLVGMQAVSPHAAIGCSGNSL